MKAVRVDTNWTYRSMKKICMENNLVRLVILPELGAKILRLIHKPSDTHLLWENPRIVPRPVPYGASYDDSFFGGWDELFPNDDPVTILGENYPDHGELWSQPWQYTVEESAGDRAVIHLWCFGSVMNARVDKWLTIHENSSVLYFRHRIENLGNNPIDFLWKLHPALNMSPNHRIDLPPCTVLRADESWSDRIGEERFAWPVCRGKHGGTVDIRTLPASGQDWKEFMYCVDIEDGWCALTDTASRIGFGMRFPKDVFRSVWLFLTCGGWRGYHTAILEPCTAYPANLDEAISNGTCSRLGAHEMLECEVEAVIYGGLQSVREIRSGGEVIGE